jgi:hypothetical protein
MPVLSFLRNKYLFDIFQGSCFFTFEDFQARGPEAILNKIKVYDQLY